jgi:hypothetical protein
LWLVVEALFCVQRVLQKYIVNELKMLPFEHQNRVYPLYSVDKFRSRSFWQPELLMPDRAVDAWQSNPSVGQHSSMLKLTAKSNFNFVDTPHPHVPCCYTLQLLQMTRICSIPSMVDLF